MKTNKKAHLMMVGARDEGYMTGADFYETPVEATESLLDWWQLPPQAIWEPSCGKGAISNVLLSRGHKVISTDLHDRGYGTPNTDFFKQHTALAPIIITNPPYNISTEYVEHACSIADKSAFLLRLVWLEGQRRREKIFNKHPLSKVLVFSKRIPRMHVPDYTGEKVSSTIAFAWFIFEKNYDGKPEIDWI